MMDEKKIDFILCYNSALYKDECVAYIEDLDVPQDVEVNVIAVEQARSLSSGYNQAMMVSNAKYKVYLHQDVFILNKNFIFDVISVFKQNPEYGMLGVIGTDQKVSNGCYWDKWDCGWTYASTPLRVMEVKGRPSTGILPVEAIDGMIMITQVDIPWREDVFDGFHFYDVSQSEEMKRAGFRVGIVPQKSPWCLHDCGANSFRDYDIYRKKFCECYQEEGYCFEVLPEQDRYRDMGIIAQKFLEALILYFNEGKWNQVGTLIQKYEGLFLYNTDLQYMLGIYGKLMKESRAAKLHKPEKTFADYKEEYLMNLFAKRRKLKNKAVEGGHGE